MTFSLDIKWPHNERVVSRVAYLVARRAQRPKTANPTEVSFRKSKRPQFRSNYLGALIPPTLKLLRVLCYWWGRCERQLPPVSIYRCHQHQYRRSDRYYNRWAWWGGRYLVAPKEPQWMDQPWKFGSYATVHRPARWVHLVACHDEMHQLTRYLPLWIHLHPPPMADSTQLRAFNLLRTRFPRQFQNHCGLKSLTYIFERSDQETMTRLRMGTITDNHQIELSSPLY